MPIKIYKTTRAARKRSSIIDRSALYKGKPLRVLVRAKQRISGRGAEGKITVRHRGGGAKRSLRVIDFAQEKQGIPGTVERLEYDPNRSAFLALILYADGERRYRLAWSSAVPGTTIMTDAQTPEIPGNRMQLQHITPGLSVFNVELRPQRGGRLVRGAGTTAILMDVKGNYAQLKMPSGEIRLIPKESYATLGQVSNPDQWLERLGSAGRVRRLGRRPQVRGKVMNPVDHPHGGGEGNQPIGLKAPKTKWGKPALGVKTRTRGKYSDAMIIARRQKKKRTK
ncbi:MAG: 50S ribosomal protein L2 [Candidatus Andersenbacteria bacterium]